MSIEDELRALARERENSAEQALVELVIQRPDILRRQFRAYLSRQVDRRRIDRMNERIPRLETVHNGLNQLTCDELEFRSGARLQFKIRLEKHQPAWSIEQFQFHLHLPVDRSVRMIRVHLNTGASYDPLMVPRCHLHVDNSEAHVPFPIMSPSLILYVLCEHVEADFGI